MRALARTVVAGAAAAAATACFFSLPDVREIGEEAREGGVDGALVDAPSGAAASSPCATAHALCEDFDPDGSLPVSSLTNGGTTALVADRATSAPLSFVSRTPATDDSHQADAQLRFDVGPPHRRFRWSASVWLEQPVWSGVGRSDILAIYFSPYPTSASLNFQIKNDAIRLMAQDGKQTPGYPIEERSDPFPYGRWVRVAIVVTFEAAAGTVAGVLEIDDTEAIRLAAVALGKPQGDVTAQMRLGMRTNNTPPDLVAWFDDAVLDWLE